MPCTDCGIWHKVQLQRIHNVDVNVELCLFAVGMYIVAIWKPRDASSDENFISVWNVHAGYFETFLRVE